MGLANVVARSFNANMRIFTMVNFSDVEELRRMGHMGARIKPGVLQGIVITFEGGIGRGAVCLTLIGGRVKAQLLSPSTCTDKHVLDVAVMNAARSMYSTHPVDIEYNPIYTADELVRVS